MGDGYPYWRLGVILFLILFLALLSAACAAFTAVNESVIRKRTEENESDKRALQILTLLEEPSRYINLFEVLKTGTSILIGILFVGTLYDGAFRKLAEMFSFTKAPVWVTYLMACMMVCLLIFLVMFLGNVLPRRLTRIWADKAVFYFLGMTNRLLYAFGPMLFLFEQATRFTFAVFRIKANREEENVTEDEIISIVNEGHEQGVLEDSEAAMISNIIEFDEKEVMDIMTHRKKIVGIDGSLTVDEAMEFVIEQSFSRFPVYDEDIDNIVGIMYLKDLTRYYVSGQDRTVAVKTICSKPFLVPDTQPIDVLWNEMRIKKVHMAIAIDEYGQTAGLVAMEDILEEIVGNISDEYDVEEKMIIKQTEGRYLMKGLVPLEDVEEILNIEFEQEDFDTLNGFLISILGHIPKDDEQTIIRYKGYSFHIVDVKDKIIRYVRVVKEV